MAEQTTYTCDVCGRTKGESNHWFRAASLPGRFTLVQWSDPTFEEVQIPVAVAHLCGLECAAKAMHKAMSD